MTYNNSNYYLNKVSSKSSIQGGDDKQLNDLITTFKKLTLEHSSKKEKIQYMLNSEIYKDITYIQNAEMRTKNIL